MKYDNPDDMRQCLAVAAGLPPHSNWEAIYDWIRVKRDAESPTEGTVAEDRLAVDSIGTIATPHSIGHCLQFTVDTDGN